MMGKFIRVILLLLITGGHLVVAQEKYPIVFKLKAPIDITTIHLAGDFNNWSKTANPLIYSGDRDIWKTVVLLEPGTYQYRFFINGLNWIKDPLNPLWGGENSNSIIHVKTPKEPLLKKLKPETGSVIKKNVFMISAEYWDGIEKNGLDVNNSKIFIDDLAQEVEYIKAKRLIRCYTPKLKDGEHIIKIKAVDNKGNQAIPITAMVHVNANNEPPQVDAGYTIISGIGEKSY